MIIEMWRRVKRFPYFRHGIQFDETSDENAMNSKREFLRAAAAVGLWTAAAGVLGQALPARPLRIGVHPYNSTLALIRIHQPLVRHLENSLGVPVEFYTAPDFNGFVSSLLGGEYDLAICPPHFAMLASHRGMAPLVHYRMRLEPIFVVRADGKLHGPADLRGRKLGMADRTAFIRIVAVKWLEEHGLVTDRDYQIVEQPSHGTAVASTALGQVDAGLTTTTSLVQVPADIRQQVRVMSIGKSFPHLVTMAKRSFGMPELLRIKTALETFQGTQEGRDFFLSSGFGGYEDVDIAEFNALQPYVDAYVKMVNPGAK